MFKQDHGPRRRSITLVALLALGTTAPASAAAASATPPPLAATGCEEHEIWADGDPAAVAARLPGRFTAFDDNGKPLIFARAERCNRLGKSGRSAPFTVADYGIVIASPDGYGCGSGLPQVGVEHGNAPPICNWYTLGYVTDNAGVARWLRQGTPGLEVRRVRGLVYRQGTPDANGASAFHFEARSPSPSMFTIDDVSSFRPGELALRGAYYFPDVRQGAVRMLVSTDDLTSGHADSILRAAAGSELAAIMGAPERASVEPYNEFGVIRPGHGVLRKQLLGPALRRERLDSFAGSCSVQGDVTFTPPATNAQAPTVYGYRATGTCTGTLDGASLKDAPVELRQSGHADASCMRALAFPPGTGVITFPGGKTLRYTVDFTSKLTENDGNVYGTRSGIATLHSTFLTQRTSPDVVAQCAGDGAQTAPMDLKLTTDSPLVSVVRSRT